MKSNLVLIVVFLTAVISCSSVDKTVYVKDAENLKKNIKVAIIPFKDAPNKKDSGTIIADALTNEMIRIAHWQMIERSQLSKIMGEKSLDATGLTDSQYTDIGRLAQTDYIVVGSVSEFYYDRQFYIIPKTKVAFNARIIHVKTGTIVGTVRYNRETNKHAWCGCLLLWWYYIPIMIFSDENINEDVGIGAKDVVNEIKKHVDIKKKGCLF